MRACCTERLRLGAGKGEKDAFLLKTSCGTLQAVIIQYLETRLLFKKVDALILNIASSKSDAGFHADARGADWDVF
jgi:hypothetical protein